jgi:hypothetical protein
MKEARPFLAEPPAWQRAFEIQAAMARHHLIRESLDYL